MSYKIMIHYDPLNVCYPPLETNGWQEVDSAETIDEALHMAEEYAMAHGEHCGRCLVEVREPYGAFTWFGRNSYL